MHDAMKRAFAGLSYAIALLALYGSMVPITAQAFGVGSAVATAAVAGYGAQAATTAADDDDGD